jgi:hypothetical protein
MRIVPLDWWVTQLPDRPGSAEFADAGKRAFAQE